MEESGLIEVRVRDCACPDTPHPEGDVVYLLPSLSLEGGTAAEMERTLALDGYDDTVSEQKRTQLILEMLARLTSVYVRYGAVGWNWLRLSKEGRPEPVPFDVDVLLRSYALSKAVAGRANDFYGTDILGPLLEAGQKPAALNRQQRRSRNGRTGRSTSARPAIAKKPRPIPKPSASSSDEPSDGPPLRIAR